MRQVEAVAVLCPAAHQDAHGGSGAGEEHEHGTGLYRSARTVSVTTPTACARRGSRGVQGVLEEPLVLLARLVLHGQRLGVVGAAALDGLLALLGRRLQRHVREVLEQPADLLGVLEEKAGPREGLGQHGGGPFGGVLGDGGHVRRYDREEDVRGVFGEPGEQAAGGVQRGGVGGRVDDGDDGVEAGGGDVVGVALAGAVGGVVVGREGEAGADGVPGVVDGEDG
ncbi:hypothetical protein STENM223S_04380 [Streptomyces tendae]